MLKAGGKDFFFLPVLSASHCQASGGSQRGNQVTANERRERERGEKGWEEVETKTGNTHEHVLFFFMIASLKLP